MFYGTQNIPNVIYITESQRLWILNQGRKQNVAGRAWALKQTAVQEAATY